MDTFEHSGHSLAQRRTRVAFTLVEVTLALGVVSFAFLAVFGLVPTGLTTFRKAVDVSVGAQIAQRVVNEAQQTDFLVLTGSSNKVRTLPVRYFDDQGNEVERPVGAIYHVNMRVNPSTAIPNSPIGTGGDLATVVVQIANNPGNQLIPVDSETGLWRDSIVPVSTRFGLVSRIR